MVSSTTQAMPRGPGAGEQDARATAAPPRPPADLPKRNYLNVAM